jgi:hypothetical protein
MAPVRDYVAVLKQLGASTPVTLQQRVVPRGGPELLDEESSDDGRLLQTQTLTQVHGLQSTVTDTG